MTAAAWLCERAAKFRTGGDLPGKNEKGARPGVGVGAGSCAPSRGTVSRFGYFPCGAWPGGWDTGVHTLSFKESAMATTSSRRPVRPCLELLESREVPMICCVPRDGGVAMQVGAVLEIFVSRPAGNAVQVID